MSKIWGILFLKRGPKLHIFGWFYLRKERATDTRKKEF